MKKNDYRPGEVIVTDFLGYQHWSIVSDRKCDDNQYKLISATRRNGTVKEEKFDTVTQGRHSYKVGDIGKPEDFLFLIDRARGWIGQWDYSILSANCEHFVNLIRFKQPAIIWQHWVLVNHFFYKVRPLQTGYIAF